MKRTLLVLLAMISVSAMTFAQGSKSLKAASKALSAFTSDFSNRAALEEAKMKIDEAFQDDEVAASAKSWNTRGEILVSIADAQMKQKLLDPAFVPSDLGAAIEGVNAYKKALELSTKKGDKKKAISGLKESENVLAGVAVEQYNAEDYLAAFKSFQAELDVYDALKAIGEPSRLDEGNNLTDKYLFAGLTGYYAQEYESTIDLLLKAKETGSTDPNVYQFLYEANEKLGNEEEALEYLSAGRAAYPEDSGLLFSEINYYLTRGELEKMIGNLETALAQEPDNISVMATLGQVFDQLATKMTAEGQPEKSTEYFNSALSNYTMALEKEPDNFDVNYSVGALYYNKAASFSDALNEAANDLSAAGTKKYDAIKEEMSGYFEQALPYFLKCDELDNTSKNTLIALKEIYVRKDMFDKSNEYKERLESLPE